MTVDRKVRMSLWVAVFAGAATVAAMLLGVDRPPEGPACYALGLLVAAIVAELTAALTSEGEGAA